MRRVVITGMGVVSAVGNSTQQFWQNVKDGRHGFTKIQGFDTTDFDIKYAAEIHNWDATEFDINKKDARRMDRFTQFALAATNQALNQSGSLAGYDPFKVGVIVGSGIGGFETYEEEHKKFIEKGASRVSVFFIPMIICNMAAGTIAIQHGFKGTNFCTVTACASATNAIGEAFRAIKHGYIDAAVAGGTEAAITMCAMAGFNNMGALSNSNDPDRLSIPFDKERNGFAMGEGAGILVLEELESAVKRGANIIAEVVGYGATSDAYHITSPAPDGSGAAKAMEFAIEEAGVKPQDIDYVNAHGTSTPLNDDFETKAIKTVFGEYAKNGLAVSSTKSVTGHLLGAAGGVEAIVCAMALNEGVIPPTANYKVKDEACDLDYVTEGARKANIKYAISNSLGFGGHNATIAFKKYQ